MPIPEITLPGKINVTGGPFGTGDSPYTMSQKINAWIDQLEVILTYVSGQSIQMRNNGTHVQWKYQDDADWVDLLSIVELAGDDGREVEFGTSATHIQWRYVGEVSWTDLVAFSTIKGEDGREVEIQKSSTHVQWRYVGDSTWINLIALSDITGTDGREVELQNSGTYIQWRYVGDVAWNNLVGIDTISGADGREVEVQNNGTHIQWRYVGDVSWTNLVAVSDLKGDKGDTGEVKATVSETPPVSPEPGQLWLDSTTMRLYSWYVDTDGGQWVDVASPSAAPIQSLTGDGVDNTDPANPVLTFPTAGEIGAVATDTSGSVDISAVWGGTQAEYDLLTPDANTLYVIVG